MLSGYIQRKIINWALDYRDVQKKKLDDSPSLKLGEVTSLNMNIIEGGVLPNVVPSHLSASKLDKGYCLSYQWLL